ncbi:MAG: polyhydroxyalkanoate synthesis repressor PhaR [Desulfobacteraceae bacterium IS3]|nr:MAG: polyhydroxyalkanoate synthesis repressor PhaR [Desulfobacteraceae bacterium IS3]HAO21563.1 polyhydroxyalkanoate synthesis repressor PhaR [Desulfobacteraceae bacterium]
MLVKKTLKKYPNRRLYDTESSSYVTLSDVAQMVRDGYQVEVSDAKTGEDVTAFILMQIVAEQTKNNHIILPSSLLHLIIRFGENTLSEFFEKYLEKSIESYLSYKKIMDEQFRIYMELRMDFSSMAEKTLKKLTPFPPFYKEDSGETDEKDSREIA